MTTVFLSYSRSDNPHVDIVHSALASAGITVWRDTSSIQPGDSLPAKIALGMRDSDYFLLFMSTSSLNSRWVQLELNIALAEELKRQRKFLIPILLSPCDLPPNNPGQSVR